MERKDQVLAARFVTGAAEVIDVEAGPLEDSPLKGAVAARALQGHQPLLVRDIARDDGPALQALVPGATNIVVVPLRAGREGQGLLLAESGPPPSRRMSRRSLDMVARFAGHAALALRNADLKAEIARLAASDPLTGPGQPSGAHHRPDPGGSPLGADQGTALPGHNGHRFLQEDQ